MKKLQKLSKFFRSHMTGIRIAFSLYLGFYFYKSGTGRLFKYTYIFDGAWSQLQYVGSLVAACRIQFPDQGWNPGPLHWQHGVLTTGPPDKTLVTETEAEDLSWVSTACSHHLPWLRFPVREDRTLSHTRCFFHGAQNIDVQLSKDAPSILYV